MENMLKMFLKVVVFLVVIASTMVGNVQGLPPCCRESHPCDPPVCVKGPCCSPPTSDAKP
jgi:hypothetical protein